MKLVSENALDHRRPDPAKFRRRPEFVVSSKKVQQGTRNKTLTASATLKSCFIIVAENMFMPRSSVTYLYF